MPYPFVPAFVKLGRRQGPVKAFVIHFAEGGGTVGFLSRPNIRGVSVHYVIERSGRIVQMVKESDATGSINPNDIRQTNDPDGFYGRTAAQAVMGSWWRNPNAASITLEIEGFAKDGPNPKQDKSLRLLVADVRTRFPSMGLLGHRDYTSRKACPGKLIPWDALGGHGPATGGSVRTYTIPDDATTGTLLPLAGRQYLRLGDETLHPMPVVGKRAYGQVRLTKGIGDDSDARSIGYIIGEEAAFLLAVDVSFRPDHGHRRSDDLG